MNNSITLLFLLGLALFAAALDVQSAEPKNEWIVVLDDPRPARLKGWQRGGYSGDGNYQNALELKRAGKRIAKKHDLTIQSEWFIESLGVYCLVANLQGDQAPALKRLRADEKVKSVQLSNRFELLNVNDDDRGEQSVKINQALLEPPELQLPASIDGRGVVVALVDSAVDQTHVDLTNSVTENLDFINDESKTSSGEAHGTAIAGVIIADRESDLGVTGIAPGAELKVYRGCWEDTADGSKNCNTLSLARALDAVATSSAADILNLSLSGPKDELLDQIVSNILVQGISVVVAHDPKRSASNRFPSMSPGVLTVRAQTMDIDKPGIFSAPGAKVVAAPQQRASFIMGHSVATAYTSGVLALCTQIEREIGEKVCTPTFFERLRDGQNNNLDKLLSELSAKLNAFTNSR